MVEYSQIPLSRLDGNVVPSKKTIEQVYTPNIFIIFSYYLWTWYTKFFLFLFGVSFYLRHGIFILLDCKNITLNAYCCMFAATNFTIEFWHIFPLLCKRSCCREYLPMSRRQRSTNSKLIMFVYLFSTIEKKRGILYFVRHRNMSF